MTIEELQEENKRLRNELSELQAKYDKIRGTPPAMARSLFDIAEECGQSPYSSEAPSSYLRKHIAKLTGKLPRKPGEDQTRWLVGEERKAFNCRNLLPAPGPEVVEQWAKWLCDEREKLAKARGFLYSFKFGEEVNEEEVKELDELLGYQEGDKYWGTKK